MTKKKHPTRRHLLAGAAAWTGGFAAIGQSRHKRPNILVAIADDHSYDHTGAAGCRAVSTPHFDRIAGTGVRFTHSFCSSPSCTPSRGAILTGQPFWRLEEGGNLWSSLPGKFAVYPNLLEAAGYHIGLKGKGWGPGNFQAGGYARNPAGPAYETFASFLQARPKDKPFCFWFGSTDPHRPYDRGSGRKAGLRLDDIEVPAWLPDSPVVREDIADYLLEVQRFDRDVGDLIAAVEKAGELENTMIVVTSDNGMPFPRAKTNLYDSGTRMPMAISWPAAVPGGRTVDDFISHTDLAPTFLQAAGAEVPGSITGRSLLPLLQSKSSGQVDRERDRVFSGRERHTQMRAGGVGYPMRAVRTKDFLYIRNYEPDRWPSGDPPHFGDIDNGPSKEFTLQHSNSPEHAKHYQLACAKRPAEELYDLRSDAAQQVNVATDQRHAEERGELSKMLHQHLERTRDPRVTGERVI
ncbi:MAG TPA: sulfatase, partial [Bryobacteraceae bacterium]|nr:sulfatase [Bryobacteraceae bacterium]